MALPSIRKVFLLCTSHPARCFSLNNARHSRFTRDSIRSRLHKQEIKEALKAPQQENIVYPDAIPLRPTSDLLKALGFTVAVGAVSFNVAFMVDWKSRKKAIEEQLKKSKAAFTSFFRENVHVDQYGNVHHSVKRDFTAGEKIAIGLIAVNCVVTALWRVRPLQPAMWRYFSNSFASKSLHLPMVLSAFSHSSLLHLLLNMYVLWSFSHLTVDKFMGPHQFAAFYLTAAAFSSWTSLVHKAAVRSSIRALGASGAILGVLAYTCCKIPDARLQIVFVPVFDFSAQTAVIGMVAFDLAGLIFRFKLFDHAAHLGGLLIGVGYAYWGERFVWGCCRKHVQKKLAPESPQ